ncbi:MAG TPA: DNA-directed RNA polymerase subunit beta' [Thermovirgaceae bacterium]|nr:DNA-directed RNA polymerase subunit beta' [Thermovirgaceae bacterium]
MNQHEITGVKIKLASPERIRGMSSGEVKKPETINYRTLRPEKDGLFCERIFGPTKSYECACGKYKRSGPKFKGVVCDRCGVEVADNRVRRERMGHIELAAPVVHIWYLRGIPSRLSLLLGTATKDLEKVVYFAPTRRRDPVMKVVIEGRRTDLIKRGDLASVCEERIHRHYDHKFKSEEANRVTHVSDVSVNAGDLVPASQVGAFKRDFGDKVCKVEPAFRVAETSSDGVFQEGQILSVTEREKILTENDSLVTERAMAGDEEGFVVTGVVHLPFKKGDVISQSERQLFEEKYPGRFSVTGETVTIEDPCYIVINGGSSPFQRGDIILEREQRLCSAYDKEFEAGIGAEGVLALLSRLNLGELVASLREEIGETTGQKKRKLVKRLQVAEDFRKSEGNPEWMVFQVLPVIPPDLRPMVQLDGGRFATSDLNDLYRRVINRNNRLRKLQELRAPEIIIRNEKRMLQESVDALIDNGRMGKAVLGAGNRPLKSLSDLLRGKKGRFRQNLLGKRVDYSGRSVIVIGPNLKLNQCGLPKQMALELFKPFVINKLVEQGLSPNVKSAKRAIERGREDVWGILEEVIKGHPVMLNRAPTLHRLGIQAFEPVLMEGKALRLHPLVCTAFNADFDGDQMAVHVPLSIEARVEAKTIMLSAKNLLSPASGKPVVTPTQDIVLGIYYVTGMIDGKKGEGKSFLGIEDALSALDHGFVDVNSKIRVKYRNEWIITSPGRALFNSILPVELRYINKQMGKKSLGALIDAAYDRVGQDSLVLMLDDIKSLGYRWSTISGISFGLGDVLIPPQKKQIVSDALEKEEVLSAQYGMGVLTEDEYLRQKETLWSEASKEAADSILANMDQSNPIKMMMESGARGSKSQVAQMAGIRGLMADPSGKIIDYPIVSNFREGLNMLEYFISTHGARKGLADTALRTAKSGYLTRRLVDVAQDLIITADDCETTQGVCIHPLLQDGKMMISLSERIIGRTSLKDITDPESGELIVAGGEMIDPSRAAMIEKAGLEEVWVRSPLTCALQDGICKKCYGMDLSSRREVLTGETVGVVAAQSIGEPGTQLTMRTFHTGGVRITGEDITQGLPRIEQLFEVRRPKKVAFLSDRDGIVSEIREMEGKRKVFISSVEEGVESKSSFNIPASQPLLVEEGQTVKKAQPLTEGHVDPQQLLEVEGLEAVQNYLVDNIQSVYLSQGVSVSNKHIEVILRKVAPVNRVRVIEEGDSSFVSMELAWVLDLEREIAKIREDNERFLVEAFEVMNGRKLVDVVGQGNIETAISLKGQVLDDKAVRQILRPGSGVSELVVEDKTGLVRVIVGAASFRRAIAGLELIESVDLDEGETLDAGTILTSAQMTKVTDARPSRLLVRDIGILDEMKDRAYLAENVISGDEIVAHADRVIDAVAAENIRNSNMETVKVWRSPETVSISDAIQKMLIDQYWARPILQAIDSEGNSIKDIPQFIDGSVVKGLDEGDISAVEMDGEILSRDAIVRKVLSDVAYGKVLLEPVTGRQGEELVPAGSEVNNQVLDAMVEANPEEIVIRPILTQTETRRLLQGVTFVRRLREEPTWKPVIHGITKAALATDSFLSAASFQQTAQVLAGAAVRGDMDSLKGLKENVIIGHLIPAGTSFDSYKDVGVIENETDPEGEPGNEPPLAV